MVWGCCYDGYGVSLSILQLSQNVAVGRPTAQSLITTLTSTTFIEDYVPSSITRQIPGH